jgi:hypothetical protein
LLGDMQYDIDRIREWMAYHAAKAREEEERKRKASNDA